MLENIKNGKAYNKFVEMVQNQGGDISYIENTEKFPKAKFIDKIIAEKEGYIYEINAEEVGKVACELGAGRIKKEDKIDYSVGITIQKKVGDKVNIGDCLGKIYAIDEKSLQEAKEKMLNIIKVQNEYVEHLKLQLDKVL
jgi:pyrimidine-nucleoside phosphorylase